MQKTKGKKKPFSKDLQQYVYHPKKLTIEDDGYPTSASFTHDHKLRIFCLFPTLK